MGDSWVIHEILSLDILLLSPDTGEMWYSAGIVVILPCFPDVRVVTNYEGSWEFGCTSIPFYEVKYSAFEITCSNLRIILEKI